MIEVTKEEFERVLKECNGEIIRLGNIVTMADKHYRRQHEEKRT